MISEYLKNVLIENLARNFPIMAKCATKYIFSDDPWEVIVKRSDGMVVLYDDRTGVVTKLPSDDNNMTPYECGIEFGRRLRKMMTKRQISQQELSEKTGISQSSISYYLTGQKLPSFYNLDKLARVLDCSTDDFRYLLKE